MTLVSLMFRSPPLGFKGHYVVGEENQSQNYNIYNTNEVEIQTQKWTTVRKVHDWEAENDCFSGIMVVK